MRKSVTVVRGMRLEEAAMSFRLGSESPNRSRESFLHHSRALMAGIRRCPMYRPFFKDLLAAAPTLPTLLAWCACLGAETLTRN